jgi:dolichol-phosphate mannosyltransferase
MISIIAPAYNEAEGIEQFVREMERAVQLKEEWECIIVNDGSHDKTGELLDKLTEEFRCLRVIHHTVNRGIGGALKTGIEAARGQIIITMDADLTHAPAFIANLVAGSQNADVCVASRFVKGGGMEGVPFYRVLLSKIANWGYRLLFFSPVQDNTGGFKAYRAELLKTLDVQERGYVVQLEIMTKLLRRHASFEEIPYILTSRTIGVSKLQYLKVIPQYLRSIAKLFLYRWF